jgi:hypothetical protein
MSCGATIVQQTSFRQEERASADGRNPTCPTRSASGIFDKTRRKRRFVDKRPEDNKCVELVVGEFLRFQRHPTGGSNKASSFGQHVQLIELLWRKHICALEDGYGAQTQHLEVWICYETDAEQFLALADATPDAR